MLWTLVMECQEGWYGVFETRSLLLCRFLNEKGHGRLGWARSSAHIQVGPFQHFKMTRTLVLQAVLTKPCLQLPVGADRFGYCMTTKEGNMVHERRPKDYTSPCGEAGTVIGFYIYLPMKDHGEVDRPTEDRDKFWWKNSGKEYYLVKYPLPLGVNATGCAMEVKWRHECVRLCFSISLFLPRLALSCSIAPHATVNTHRMKTRTQDKRYTRAA